jgi:hypothetical protein
MKRRTALTAIIAVLGAVAFGQAPAPAPRAPLVECKAGSDAACVVLATKPADLVGVWKQYAGAPPFAAVGGMGFIRYQADGAYALAPTLEGTRNAATAFASGRVTFAGSRMTVKVDSAGAPAECVTGDFEVRVIRLGDRPVALHYTPIKDSCPGRLADLSQALVYVGSDR